MEQISGNSKLNERLAAVRQNNSEPEVSAPKDDIKLSPDEAIALANKLDIQNEESTDDIVSRGRSETVVTVVPTEKVDPVLQPGDELMSAMNAAREEANVISKELAEKVEAQAKINDTTSVNVEETTEDNPDISVTVDDEVDSIMEAIVESEYDDSDEHKNEDIETMLNRLESEKVFVEVDPNEYDSGPANYVVETDASYLDIVDNVLDNNNIKFTKVTDKERTAILERFINSGTKASVILPNSGIFVQIAGAGIDELIAMSKIESTNPMEDELKRLAYIVNHITNSTIGKMKLTHLIEVVSFFDIGTLYYALFAATHPDNIELSRVCDRCRNSYFMKQRTRDLLLNYKDYEKNATDIRENVTTYQRLIETSKLGKVHKKTHSNGMIVYYKHPSIKAYLTTSNQLTEDTLQRFEDVIDIIYCIDKIAIPGNNGAFVEIKNPNEIARLIGSLKSGDERIEMYEIISSILPESHPYYGYKSCTCPHCGATNKEDGINIPTLLFTFAQDEAFMANLRRAVKLEKKKIESTKK